MPSTGNRRINWKVKAALQRCLSRCPLGFQVNYLLQRRVWGSLPLDQAGVREMARIADHHLQALAAYGAKPPERALLLEVGSGTDLTIPMLLYSHGVERQFTIDIRLLARRSLVNSSLESLNSIDLPLRRRPGGSIPPGQDLCSVLRRRYGIRYVAPCDARRTGLAAGSIDFVHSTDTLEHVPARDIPLILTECRRLLARGGVVSLYIDYRDHYSYADPAINVYNFLAYSDSDWERYNCALQYQNRLRHSDYLALAQSCGFKLAAQRPIEPSSADLRAIEAMKIDNRFCRYETADLAVQGSHLVLTAN